MAIDADIQPTQTRKSTRDILLLVGFVCRIFRFVLRKRDDNSKS